MRRGIELRFFGVVLLVLVAFLGSVLVTNFWTLDRAQRRFAAQWYAEAVRAGALDACERDPGRWSWRGQAGTALWALDASGRTMAPDAPRVEVPVPEAHPGEIIVPGEGFWSRLDWVGRATAGTDRGPGWIAVVDTGREGPCRHLAVTQDRWMTLERDEMMRIAIARLVSFAVLLLLAGLVTVWPLVVRLRRMAARTRAIVEADFHGEVSPGGRDELDELGRAFDRASAAARERLGLLHRRDEIAREVLANVAHDVRTPIAALKIAVGRLAEGASDAATASTARTELDHLDALVGNLSAVVHLEGSAIPLASRPFDAREVVDRVVARHRMVAAGRSVSVEGSVPDGPVRVTGDEVAIEQALGNLVQNAVDFASRNVAVLLYEENAMISMEVHDDGPGVDAIEIPKLADRFARGSANAARGRKGQGLGLAIAAEVARRHGGTLDLSRRPEGGTRARIAIPLGAAG